MIRKPRKPARAAIDAPRKSHHKTPMTQPAAASMDDYSRRYHALSLAVTAPLDYKKPEDVIAVAKKFEAYLAGDKK